MRSESGLYFKYTDWENNEQQTCLFVCGSASVCSERKTQGTFPSALAHPVQGPCAVKDPELKRVQDLCLPSFPEGPNCLLGSGGTERSWTLASFHLHVAAGARQAFWGENTVSAKGTVQLSHSFLLVGGEEPPACAVWHCTAATGARLCLSIQMCKTQV